MKNGLGWRITPELVQGSMVLALISAVVVAGLFAYRGRRTRQRVFGLWALGWLFYGMYLAGKLCDRYLAESWLTLLLPAASVALSGMLMACGNLEMLNRKVTRGRIFFWAVMVVAICIGSVVEDWLPWFTSVAFLVLAVAVGCAGFLYYRAGHSTVSACMAVGGFLVCALTVGGIPAFEGVTALMASGQAVTAVCLTAIALGMIVEHELKSSEQKYRSVLDGTRDSMFMVDLWTVKVLDVNQAAARLLRREAADLVGSSFPDLCPDLREKAANQVDNRSMFAAVFKPFSEFHVVRADGAMVLCEGETTLVQWHNRPVMQVRVREAKADQQVSQMVRRAEKMSSLGQLIAGVAHELNNPLAVVVASAQMMGKKAIEDPELRENLQRMHHESERAAKIVRDLLTFARPCEPQMVPVDLNQLVCNVLDVRERDFGTHKIDLRPHLKPALAWTKADPIQIEQVLNNLITNAIHAMASRPGNRVLRVVTQETNFFIRISVEDSGCGIAPEILSKIFDPFFTTKPPGKGTGLGLSISHSILQEHHGKIWVESEVGKGAKFHLEVPVVACVPVPVPLPVQPALVAEALSKQPRRLLIVDDEPGIRDVLEAILSGDGYDVNTAGNGIEAMELVKTNRYDLVLSDMCMPEMDGEKLYEMIQKHDARLTKRIVFITGDTVSVKSRAFLERTGVRWLSKPFNIKDVEELVSSLVEPAPTGVEAQLAELLRG